MTGRPGQATLAVLTANELVDIDPRVSTVEYRKLPPAPRHDLDVTGVRRRFAGLLQVTVDYRDADTGGRRRLTYNLNPEASTASTEVVTYWNVWLLDLPDDVRHAEFDGVPTGMTHLDGDELRTPPDPEVIAAHLAGLLTTRG